MNRIGRSVCTELKRGLSNKSLRIILIATLAYWVIELIFYGLFYVTEYYFGGGFENIRLYGNPSAFTFNMWINNFFSNQIFSWYLPFLASAVFSYSIIDDRKSGFCSQIFLKSSFNRYYAAKLTASGLLGGLVCSIQSVFIYLVAYFGIDHNPFLQDVLKDQYRVMNEIYGNVLEFEGSIQLFSGEYVNVNVFQYFIYSLLVLFLFGVSYGMMGCILAFFTDNKLLVYMVPVLLPQIYDKIISAVDILIEEAFSLNMELSAHFSLTNIFYSENMSIILLLCLLLTACFTRDRIRLKYEEGER